MPFEETRNANPKNLIHGATGDWEIVIGMEVHAQVASQSKLFSGAATAFGAEPNAQVSLVDAAMPGMLPVVNEECVKQAIRTGLVLNATINPHSVFARKNYFYPDLPQGYQISQYDQPIVSEGSVLIEAPEKVCIGIERLHLEQDAGKSLHDQHSTMSAIDLNRSGVALMEIVSKPDIRSADEAQAVVSKLQTLLQWYGTSDADMEKGNLRADINVSVRRPGEKLGTRCEIKNVNSIRFIGQAIEHEARRQVEILEAGGSIEQETRLFDPDRDETRSMRSKEEAHDYRYFPDPDLLPLDFDNAYVEILKAGLPESQDVKKERFTKWGIRAEDVGWLVAKRKVAEDFEARWSDLHGREPSIPIMTFVNFYRQDYAREANARGLVTTDLQISAANTSALVVGIFTGAMTRPQSKQVLYELLKPGYGQKQYGQIVADLGIGPPMDTGAIEAIVDKVIAENPDKASQAKAKPAMLGWFVGQVMKASQGKANPQAVNALLKAKLGIA